MTRVLQQRDGHVLVIELNRPEKKNAADMQLLHELSAVLGELDRDPELRVGVICAAGSDFTAGLDLADVAPRIRDGRLGMVAEGGCDPWRMGNGPECRKPVVVAVNGLCLTLGIELAAASDLVLAASDARFGQIEVARGILPFGGATLRLPLRIGWGAAMRWMLGAELHSAEDAYRLGLVQELVEPGALRERALERAHRIADQAPLAVQATLANARAAERAGAEAAAAGLPSALTALMHSEDAQRAVAAYLSGETPTFVGK
ncbi:MAG: crotonase/enoyl-CoA hydratase family protein [Agromyces sp.]